MLHDSLQTDLSSAYVDLTTVYVHGANLQDEISLGDIDSWLDHIMTILKEILNVVLLTV